MSKFHFSSLILITFFLFSCKKDTDEVNFYHEYFPLEEGTFVEYEVTKIKHDASTFGHDTTIFLMKTVVGDTVIDNSGRIARKFYRYIYNEVLQEYKIQDLWTAIIDQERAELVEENQRVIKLVFAPTLSKEWDKNAFNSYDPVMVYYDEIHKPYFINGISVDSSLIVVEDDSPPNFIQYKQKYEVYGKGIGLLKKFYKDFTITSGDTLHPVKGDELFYVIKSYGVE